MELITVMSIVFSVFAFCLLTAWLDNRNNWRLADWLNGRCSNPFVAKDMDDKDHKIKALSERIAVLEKLITEPSYELNKKLEKLKA